MTNPTTPPKPELKPDVFANEVRKTAGDPNITDAQAHAEKKGMPKVATAKEVGAKIRSNRDKAQQTKIAEASKKKPKK